MVLVALLFSSSSMCRACRAITYLPDDKFAVSTPGTQFYLFNLPRIERGRGLLADHWRSVRP